MQSLELEIPKFIAELKSKKDRTESELELVIYTGMEKLINIFVGQNLSDCSDIKYNEQLAKSIIAIEDFHDLIKDSNPNEYTIRKHIRNIMKIYVGEVNRARKIIVNDKSKFGFQMESIGLNVGWTSETTSSRNMTPDGNVLVLAGLTLAVLALVVLRK